MISPFAMRIANFTGLFLAVLAGLVLAGCDDTFIDPFENDGKYYTVYGFLDQSRNFEGASHALRVIPVTRQSGRIIDPSTEQASIDARVFTIDLSTDREIEWNHSLEELADGTYGHIFRSRVFVQPNHVYRLEVRRSDGIVTYAESRVPTVSNIIPVLDAPRFNIPSDSSSSLLQDISLPGAESVWTIDMVYHTGGASCIGSSAQAVSYGRTGAATTGGWHFTANISADIAALAQRLGSANFTVCAMGLRARILDQNWVYPEGELDLDMLANPDVLTNVVNGYGFFGSIAVLLYDWPVSNELAELLNR